MIPALVRANWTAEQIASTSAWVAVGIFLAVYILVVAALTPRKMEDR
jgi:hypothetical protein